MTLLPLSPVDRILARINAGPRLPKFRLPGILGEDTEQPESFRRIGSSRNRVWDPLTPEEESSVLGTLGRGAMSGLAFAGNVLDVAGQPTRQLISSGLSGLGFRPSANAVSTGEPTGRDLLEQVGILSANKPGFDLGDVAGFAVDVLADPLTYLTFGAGALTKAGRIAGKAGLLEGAAKVASQKAGKAVGKRVARQTTTLGDLLQAAGPEGLGAAERAATASGLSLDALRGEKLGGLVGLRVPFRQPIGVIGTGERAQKWAGRMDWLGEKARWSAPGRWAARLMNADIGEARTRPGQELATDIAEQRRLGVREARGFIAEQIQRALDANILDNPGAIRQALEKVGPAGQGEALDALADANARMAADILAQKQRFGYPTEALTDPAGVAYAARQASIPQRFGKPAAVFGAYDPNAIRRIDPYRGITGGTESLRQIISDPIIGQFIESGASATNVAGLIEAKFPGVVPPKMKIKTRTGIEKEVSQPLALAKRMIRMPAEARAEGLFGNHPQVDQAVMLTASKESLASTDRIFDFLASADKTVGAVQSQATLRAAKKFQVGDQVADKAGTSFGRVAAVNPDGSINVNFVDPKTGITGATLQPADVLRVMRNKTAPKGMVSVDRIFRRLGLQAGDETGGALLELANRKGTQWNPSLLDTFIPQDVAADIVRVHEGFHNPKAVSELRESLRSFTNLFKGLATGVRPAFHNRNLISGMTNNWFAGLWSSGSMRNAWRMLRGHDVKGAADLPIVKEAYAAQDLAQRGIKLTDQVGTKLLRQLAYQFDLIPGQLGEDIIAGAGSPGMLGMAEILRDFPGLHPVRLRDIGKHAAFVGKETSFKPWELAGVGGRTESRFGPALAGKEMGHYVEGLNRLTPFLEGLKQGWDPGALRKKIMAAQVEYSNRAYSAFEREYLMMAFPFYKFFSRMIPWTLRQMVEQPGGKLGTTLKAVYRGQQDEFVPEHVGRTAAIPLPAGKTGDRRYLSALGLAPEDPLAFVGAGPQGGMFELIGRLNPLLKGPLEYATGTSFWQPGPTGGRPLAAMDPPLGRLLANLTGSKLPVGGIPLAIESTLMNLPGTGTLLTAARQATDPRKEWWAKGLNLLTGTKVTDVPEWLRQKTEAEAIHKRLLGNPAVRTVEVPYVPADMRGELSPAEFLLMRRLNDIRTQQRTRGKEEKQGQPRIGVRLP